MAEERPTGSRKNTSGAASRKSAGDREDLDRAISSTYPDYHHYHHDTEAIDDDDDDTDLAEKESEDTENSEIVAEVRGGILDHRDLESGDLKLEKARTSRSAKSAAKDPNLVTWDGPDDPENPKNWSIKRKWAATLVGKANGTPLR